MSTAAPAGNISDKHSKFEYDEAVKSFEAIGSKLEDLMSIIKEVNVKIDEAERRRKKAMLQAKLFRLQRLRKASAKSEEDEAVSERDYGGKLSVSTHSAPAVPKREEDEAKREEDEVKRKLKKLEEDEDEAKREEDEDEDEDEEARRHIEELRSHLEEAKRSVEETRAKREASLKAKGISAQGKGQQGEVKEENKGTVIGAGQTPDYWPELKKAWARYEGIGLLSSA